ncbi:MAG: hypothetical protein ACRERE_04760 [Candidatus Entotheonellia bacterium]
MDAQQQHTLWAIAAEHYEAAQLTAQQGWHNVSVACSYYAVYTVMWLALDAPPGGQWSHAGILQHFAPGSWRQPPTPLARALIRAIRRLYNARVQAQYLRERLTSSDSAEGFHTAHQVLPLVASTFGLSHGEIRP